ncbi:hypothetical protein ACJX0J_009647, partial [Zea mays]
MYMLPINFHNFWQKLFISSIGFTVFFKIQLYIFRKTIYIGAILIGMNLGFHVCLYIYIYIGFWWRVREGATDLEKMSTDIKVLIKKPTFEPLFSILPLISILVQNYRAFMDP